MNHFRIERSIKAPLEEVWAAADFKKSAGPFPMEVKNEGDPALQGVGFQRAVTSGGRKVIERLEGIDPPNSYTYTMVEGVPVKEGYIGKAEFAPKGDTTQITWTGSFMPKVPGTGWLITLITIRIVNKIIDEIEKTCCRVG